MKLVQRKKEQSGGRFILLYGPTGEGKTVSVLQSAPDPILVARLEARDLAPSLAAVHEGRPDQNLPGRKDLDYDEAVYESWDPMMEFLADFNNTKRYSTILVDGLSFLMNISLSSEIQDQAFEARKEDEQKIKPLVGRTKMSQEAFGGLASNMFRFLRILGRISEQGKVVIVTCLEHDVPKWNRELSAGPALKGREFPNNLPGFFDLIGKVQGRQRPVEGSGTAEVLYPPAVFFESIDGSFMAKYTGPGTKRMGPLNVTKILENNGWKQPTQKGGGKK